jgi:Tfp pilus assembly protein FimT
VELVVVLVIVAILAGAAAPSLAGLSGTRTRAAARVLARDLRYAREHALDTGTGVWVSINAASESYTMLRESESSPGRADATQLTDPGTGRAFAQVFGTGEFAGVGIGTVSIGGGSGSEVGFDWRGRPRDQTEALLTGVGVITLTGSISVTIEPETGLARVSP